MQKLILFMLICFASFAEANHKEGYIELEQAKLYYQSFGQGDPIIIVHGGPCAGMSYLLPQMKELAKNHQIIFYDQRGCGKSCASIINEKTVTIEQFVQDLEDFRKKLHLEKFTLMGHSFGALLSMNYAIKYPLQVNKMILVSSETSNSNDFKIFMNEWEKRLAPMQVELEALEKSKAFKDGRQEAIDEYSFLLYSVYFKNPADMEKLSVANYSKKQEKLEQQISDIFVNDYLAGPYDIRPKLKTLQMPVLMIHGDYDVTPLKTAINTQKSIPNAELVVIKNCGHFPHVEKPKEFFAIIEKFLR